jgi:L-lactate dehydrogenase complex protein LldE
LVDVNTPSIAAQLFITCIVDAFYPQVGRAVVDVLESRGVAVDFPEDQTCCGQPAFNAGHREEARAMAAHTVEVLDATDGPIVVPSASCAAMIVHQYEGLLGEDEELVAAARRVGARVREFTQFLVDDLGIDGLTASTSGPLTFHPSCHGLRHLDLGGYGEQVLDEVSVDRKPLRAADECCGFGGLFALEMPEISGALMDTKIDHVEATGAETLVGYDMSCLMHLAGGMRRRGAQIEVRHIAEILAEEDDS